MTLELDQKEQVNYEKLVSELRIIGQNFEKYNYRFKTSNGKISGWFIHSVKLNTLPSTISNLKYLENLVIEESTIENMSTGIFSECSMLKSVSIRKSTIKELADEVFSNTQNIEHLNFDRTELDKIPTSVFHLPLKSLSLNYTRIDSLPRSLSNLGNTLQELSLSGNQIDHLHPSIGALTSLKILIVRQNKLTDIPNEIGTLSNLEALNLGMNDLTSIPAFLGNLTNLKILKLDHNELADIQSIPTSIGNLKKLEELRLDENKLTKLPVSIGNLTDLRTLTVKNNQLEMIAELTEMTKLRRIECSGNNLKQLPDLPFSNLEYVKAAKNYIHELPSISSSKIKELDFSYNLIRKITRFIEVDQKIKILNLNKNPIEKISVDSFSSLHIDKLYLTKVRLQSLTAEVFKDCSIGQLSVQGIETNQFESEILDQSIEEIRLELSDFTIDYLYELFLQSKDDDIIPESISFNKFNEMVKEGKFGVRSDYKDAKNWEKISRNEKIPPEIKDSIKFRISTQPLSYLKIYYYEIEYKELYKAGTLKMGTTRSRPPKKSTDDYIFLSNVDFYLKSTITQYGQIIIRLGLINYSHKSKLNRLRLLQENKNNNSYNDITTKIDPSRAMIEGKTSSFEYVRVAFCHREMDRYPEVEYGSVTKQRFEEYQTGPFVYGYIR